MLHTLFSLLIFSQLNLFSKINENSLKNVCIIQINVISLQQLKTLKNRNYESNY